jgi:hypothetical protein
MTPEQAEVHDTSAALLRLTTVRKVVALLRPLPVRKRVTILALAVRDGSMTRVWADQVQIALTLTNNGEARSRRSIVAL